MGNAIELIDTLKKGGGPLINRHLHCSCDDAYANQIEQCFAPMIWDVKKCQGFKQFSNKNTRIYSAMFYHLPTV
jgi:hypothetical protein